MISRRILVLFGLLLSFGAPASAERVMLGYYPTFGGLPVEQIPWDHLTHLCHAFQRIDAEGALVTSDAVPNAALIADGRRAGVPVLLSVGGGNTVRSLEKLAQTDGGLETLADQIVEVVRIGRYAGVDLDWEFPRNEATGSAHAQLLALLRARLNTLTEGNAQAQPYLLTATTSASDDFGRWIDTDRVVPAVDWLHVMAYDMSGSWSRVAAHHAPLFPSPDDPQRAWRSVSAAMRYWESRGVPKSKLVMGVPLYGRAMPAAALHEPLSDDDADKHAARTFAQVRQLAGEGWPAAWDATAHAPWLRKPAPESTGSPLTSIESESDETPAIITYDDRNSVDAKARWAREQGYRGLFFWAVHQDRMPNGKHWLLEAAGTAWPE